MQIQLLQSKFKIKKLMNLNVFFLNFNFVFQTISEYAVLYIILIFFNKLNFRQL